MTQRTITLTVDDRVLFDMVKAAGDGGTALGLRLVTALLTGGSAGVVDDLGMAVYGVTAQPSQPLAEAVNALVAAAHGASSAAGWWNDPETGADLSEQRFFPYVVGTNLMLMVSELSEAMEGHRKGLQDDKLPHRTMIEVELADALLRIGDLAGKLRCDVGGALVEKMAFNAVRPDHKPGARLAAGGKAY